MYWHCSDTGLDFCQASFQDSREHLFSLVFHSNHSIQLRYHLLNRQSNRSSHHITFWSQIVNKAVSAPVQVSVWRLHQRLSYPNRVCRFRSPAGPSDGWHPHTVFTCESEGGETLLVMLQAAAFFCRDTIRTQQQSRVDYISNHISSKMIG